MTIETEDVVEAADALDLVAAALQEVHALSGLGDPAFDASMFGQIAAVQRGASLLRRAALSATPIERLREENARVVTAAQRALNYIENTEGELGIKLESGDMLRAALNQQ